VSAAAVLSIQSGINKVRYATLKGIMAAKKKEIAAMTRESLGVSHEPRRRSRKFTCRQKPRKRIPDRYAEEVARS